MRACGGTELDVSEVHRLVELHMQIVSHSDEVGDQLVECLDVLLGDEQARLGDRGARRARAGSQLAARTLLGLLIVPVLLVRRRQRKARLERIRVRERVVRVVALGVPPVPVLRAVAYAPPVLAFSRPARVHEGRHHAHLAVLVLAAVEIVLKVVEPTARGFFAWLAVHRVPRLRLLLRLRLVAG